MKNFQLSGEAKVLQEDRVTSYKIVALKNKKSDGGGSHCETFDE